MDSERIEERRPPRRNTPLRLPHATGVERARAALRPHLPETPLVRSELLSRALGAEVWLKNETVSPIASFKLRGAANAVRSAPAEQLRAGLVTASAGNMGRAVAWLARELGLSATIVVPEHAPRTKIDAIERLGGEVVRVPYADWWRAIETSRAEGVEGFFVHPVSDPAVMAGNGTIGLEILDEVLAIADEYST